MPPKLRVLADGQPPARPKRPRWLAPRKWLSLEAKLEWQKIAPRLHERGLLTRLDLDSLAAYCMVITTWRQLRSQPNPDLQMIRMYADQVTGWAAQFFLTPADRLLVREVHGDEEDLLALLK